MHSTLSPAAPLLARIAASLLGSYALTWGIVTFGITALVALGASYEEAYLTLKLLAFLIFLGLFLWAYVVQRLLLLWAVLLGGAAVFTGAAWWLQQYLLQGS